MGWTSKNANYYKNGKVDKVSEVVALLHDEGSCKVLKASSVGSIVYAAVERFVNNERIVFGTVVLTSTDMKGYHNFFYKILDETMGPAYTKCPVGILKLLTPTDNEYANEWRNACLENIKAKKAKKSDPNSLSNLPIGSTIEMNYWEDDTPSLTLEKINTSTRKQPIWVSHVTGYRYSRDTIETQGFKVLKRAEA